MLNLSEVAPLTDFTPWIRLLDPTGAVVTSDFAATVALVNVTAQMTGTYTVIVGTADSGNDAGGDYILTLTFEP